MFDGSRLIIYEADQECAGSLDGVSTSGIDVYTRRGQNGDYVSFRDPSPARSSGQNGYSFCSNLLFVVGLEFTQQVRRINVPGQDDQVKVRKS